MVKEESKTLDIESLELSDQVIFPSSSSHTSRKEKLKTRLDNIRSDSNNFHQSNKEELKTFVNEFRFGEVESKSLFDSFKDLLRENRRLKPVKQKTTSVSLKKQKKLKFLVSLLKAHEIGGSSGSESQMEPIAGLLENPNLIVI